MKHTKLLSLIMAIVMVLSLLPVGAFAAETEEVSLPAQHETMAIEGELAGVRFYGASSHF